MQSIDEANELATFTEEGHENYLKRMEEAGEPAAPSAPTKKKRAPRKKKAVISTADVIIKEKDPVDPTDEWTDEPETVPARRIPIEEDEESWWGQQSNNPSQSYFSYGNPFFSFSKQAQDLEVESIKPSAKKGKQGEKPDDEEGKLKRKIIHQIGRYKEKFNLKLRKQPTEKMSVPELEELKAQVRFQITEKEGARMVKTLYVGGMTAVDNLSQAAGYRELRGVGKVAEAVAEDDDNELLWEELAIEFEDFLHVSPQRRLILLTAKVLLTTVKINTDPTYAAFMRQQMNAEAEELKKEFQDV